MIPETCNDDVFSFCNDYICDEDRETSVEAEQKVLKRRGCRIDIQIFLV